ncbi:TonB-dependent receptor domain-containing protein [Aurantiacibacter marinus]|nr:TonB-dependent receptor [Aurantiacibacter marinus]
MADPAVTEGERIVVTGSRIARQNVDTAAPVAVVDSEEFSLSGTVNIENVINTLPQVVPGFTSNSNNPGNGTATVDLRGLGAARTMVLVNGRRWMFYDTAQQVDLNTIPQFLLETVDVVTGGASAVYGSDALAGVVNFNLRHVDGVELGGQYSITDEWDADRYQVHGAIGTEFGDGRGRATVYAEYFNRESLFQGERGFSEFALSELPANFGPPLQQGGSSTLPSGVLRYLGGASGTATLPAGTEFGNAGAVGFGTGVVFDDVAGDFRRRAGDAYNYAPVNYLQVPQERYLLGGMAEYEIADGHEVYTEVSFVNNRVAGELASTPVTGNFNVNLAAVQPFLIAGDFAQLQSIDANETVANAAFNAAMADQDPDTPGVQFTPVTDDPGVVNFFVQRRVTETGARNSLDERNAFRVVGGIRGDITDYINYDAYYMYARTRNSQIQAGNISRSAFQAGLDGSAPAINIFGADTLTPTMVNQISILAQNSDISELSVATGFLSGTFGDAAIGNAAPIGFALGAEYRKVSSQFVPDTALSSGDVIGFNAGQSTQGSYDVKEFFGELDIPILDTDSGMTLDINLAGRYSDYSLEAIGGVWTYAGGIEFAPIPDVKFRAQYQRAVRAPNVGELFGGRAIGFPTVSDPCADANNVNDATIIALCEGTGVPVGSTGDPDLQPNAQTPAIFGGNGNLFEETSDSWTVGVVIQPTSVPGLSLTVDYFNIEIENAIANFGGGLNNTLNLCYNVVQDLSSIYCQAINGSRVNGAITTANPPLIISSNVAALQVSGIDLQLNYSTDVPFSLFTSNGASDLSFAFLGTWTETNDTFPVAGFDTVIECAGRFGTTCNNPTPSFKWTNRLSWVDGPMTVSTRWRHLSAVDDDDDNTDYTAFNGIERIKAYDLIDLTLSYDFNEALTFSVGVNNLFDTLPDTPTFDANGVVQGRPNSLLLGDNQEQANTYPSTYDVLGRDFFASVLVRF